MSNQRPYLTIKNVNYFV